MKKDKNTLSITAEITQAEELLYAPRIRAIVEELANESSSPLQIITPLYNRADRLLAKIAIEMGLELAVLLPMPRALLVSDLDSVARCAFDTLISEAHSIDTIPLYWDNTLESIASDGIDRAYQFVELRRVLAQSVDEMIALWDSKESYIFGSVGHVVRMREDYGRELVLVDIGLYPKHPQ